jgi:TRAP-type C4-dicarboxylate transport system substrate-binding protein
MRLETWDSLPPDIQKIIEDSLPWFYEKMTKADIQKTQDVMDEAAKRGVEFIELSEEDQTVIFSLAEKLALQKAAELDAKGLPGTKIFQRARQLIEEYNKTHTLWP